jgi:hypothetical protein
MKELKKNYCQTVNFAVTSELKNIVYEQSITSVQDFSTPVRFLTSFVINVMHVDFD